MPGSPPQLRASTLENPAPPDKARRPWAAGLFLLALGVVTWGSLTPSPPSVEVSNFDKVQHFAAYAVLAALAFAAARRPAWRAAVFLVAYGVLMEVLQAVTGFGRQISAVDIAANTAGVGAVWLAAARLARRRRKAF